MVKYRTGDDYEIIEECHLKDFNFVFAGIALIIIEEADDEDAIWDFLEREYAKQPEIPTEDAINDNFRYPEALIYDLINVGLVRRESVPKWQMENILKCLKVNMIHSDYENKDLWPEIYEEG